MTENVKENTPIIRVKELEKYFLAKRGYIHMSQYVKAVRQTRSPHLSDRAAAANQHSAEQL